MTDNMITVLLKLAILNHMFIASNQIATSKKYFLSILVFLAYVLHSLISVLNTAHTSLFQS